MTTAISTAFGMRQQLDDNSAEVRQAERHFHETQTLLYRLTTESLERKAYLYSQEATHERKLAARLRRQAQEISRRECLRDTWTAHSGHVQAALFVATVLIGFGYEILSGAIVSDIWQKEQPVALTFFFFFTMLSIGCGLCAVSLLLVRYNRLANFDFETQYKTYRCGHVHEEMVSYIECNCRWLEQYSHVALLASAVSGLISLMIFSFDKFQHEAGSMLGLFPRLEFLIEKSIQTLAASSSSNSSSSNSSISSVQTLLLQEEAEVIAVAGTVGRTIASPVIFCLIVGFSIIGIIIFDIFVPSDTLAKRPEIEPHHHQKHHHHHRHQHSQQNGKKEEKPDNDDEEMMEKKSQQQQQQQKQEEELGSPTTKASSPLFVLPNKHDLALYGEGPSPTVLSASSPTFEKVSSPLFAASSPGSGGKKEEGKKNKKRKKLTATAAATAAAGGGGGGGGGEGSNWSSSGSSCTSCSNSKRGEEEEGYDDEEEDSYYNSRAGIGRDGEKSDDLSTILGQDEKEEEEEYRRKQKIARMLKEQQEEFGSTVTPPTTIVSEGRSRAGGSIDFVVNADSENNVSQTFSIVTEDLVATIPVLSKKQKMQMLWNQAGATGVS